MAAFTSELSRLTLLLTVFAAVFAVGAAFGDRAIAGGVGALRGISHRATSCRKFYAPRAVLASTFAELLNHRCGRSHCELQRVAVLSARMKRLLPTLVVLLFWP